jgi:hypothetical protein
MELPLTRQRPIDGKFSRTWRCDRIGGPSSCKHVIHSDLSLNVQNFQKKKSQDQGGEGRSEHTRGFCPPVCRALRAQVWSQAIASHTTSARGLLRAFRRREPACLLPGLFTSSPQGASARSRSESTAGWPHAPGDGSTIQFSSLFALRIRAGEIEFGGIASFPNG